MDNSLQNNMHTGDILYLAHESEVLVFFMYSETWLRSTLAAAVQYAILYYIWPHCNQTYMLKD